MDRKKFLKLSCSSAMAGMALAAFPNPLRAKPDPIPDTFIGDWDMDENIDLHIVLYTEAILEYEQSENYRTVEVELRKKYYELSGAVKTEYDTLIQATYKIQEAPVLIEGQESIYQAEARLEEMETNKLDAEVNRWLSLEISFEEVNLEITTSFMGKTVSLYSTDTFICTACMQAKGFSRDCRELKILRSFRNEYAMGSLEGRRLIREYAEVGPTLVNVIESSHNRDQMYTAVYETLVLPAIALIHEGRKEAAMQFYKEYVKGLNKKLCRA